jgi:hypothetical protein
MKEAASASQTVEAIVMTTPFRSQSAKLRILRYGGQEVKIEFAHMRRIVKADRG